MVKHLLSIDDLTDAEIATIFARAQGIENGSVPLIRQQLVAGLLFGQTSLRTRVGFASAVARLGWNSVEILGRRHDATSVSESWADTLRTVSGYLDILVGRPGEHLPRALLSDSLVIPYVNGGSVGPNAEHPTQALIDLFAIDRFKGRVEDLSIALCGDLRMRAVRSLLRLLARIPPRRLVLVTVPELDDPLPPRLADLAEYRDLTDLGAVDVLYAIGIPHRTVPEGVRDTLRVTTETLSRLPDDAILLSPMPVIDEIDPVARLDHRNRMFDQSDLALFVRMAVLEECARR